MSIIYQNLVNLVVKHFLLKLLSILSASIKLKSSIEFQSIFNKLKTRKAYINPYFMIIIAMFMTLDLVNERFFKLLLNLYKQFLIIFHQMILKSLKEEI